MGQVRHGCATTTHAVRAAIQRSQASLATLSRELGINPKTVAKWRKRATVDDLKTGPKAPHSTTLSEAEEAMVGECQEFRVRAGIEGKKETRYVPTQRACDTERAA